MPSAPAIADGAPVAEPDAIPSLSSDLLVRSASTTAATDAPSDLLCTKGAATTTRSRSYDHKDAFEPAQGATAPPSDADEFGSWLKYEGSLAVPADQKIALNDDERPTSWFKYETKPLASLLDPRETPRQKPLIHLSGAEPSAPKAPTDAATTEAGAIEPAGVPLEPTPVEAVEVPSIPVEAAAVAEDLSVDAVPEPENASLATEESAVDAPAAAALVPRPSMPEQALSVAMRPNPADSPQDPGSVAEAQAERAAEIQEPAADTPSLDGSANVEQAFDQPIEAAPDRSDDLIAMPVECAGGDSIVTANAALPDEPPSVDERIAVATEAAAVTPAMPVEALESTQAPESPAPAVMASAFEAAVIAEDATVAEESTGVVAPEINLRSTAKKAMLARLAEMLEQALLRKRAPGAPESAQPAAPVLESPSAPVEPSLPEVSAAADAEGSEALSSDDTEQASAIAAPEIVPAVEEISPFAISDPQTSPEISKARAVEPTFAQSEEPATEIAAPETQSWGSDILPSDDAGAPELAAVSAIEIDSAIVVTEETRVEPESPEDMLDPIVDERVAEPPSETITEPAPAPMEPSDDLDAVSGLSAVPAPAPEGNVAFAPLTRLMERVLSWKRSDIPQEPAPVPELDQLASEPDSVEAIPATVAGDTMVSSDFAPEPPRTEPAPVFAVAVEPVAPEASTIEPVTAYHLETSLASELSVDTAEIDALPEPAPLAETGIAEIEATHRLSDRETEEPDQAPEKIDMAPDDLTRESSAPAPFGIVDETPAVVPASVDTETTDAADALAVSPAISVNLLDDATTPVATADEPLPEPTMPAIPTGPVVEIAAAHGEPPAIEPVEAPIEHDADAPLRASVEWAEMGPERAIEQGAAGIVALELPPAEGATHSADGTNKTAAPTEQHTSAADSPPEEPTPASDRPAASAVPVSCIDQEKAARQVLTDDLADIIHDVLATTQFASKAMKPGRYTHAQMLLDAEPADPINELAQEPLPHPVAIRSRLGRMERLLAFASVGMMIAVGYFTFSMWGDGRTVAAPTPAIAAPAASPDPWGERTRDIARDLGSAAAVIDLPGASGRAPQAPPNAGVTPPLPHASKLAP